MTTSSEWDWASALVPRTSRYQGGRDRKQREKAQHKDENLPISVPNLSHQFFYLVILPVLITRQQKNVIRSPGGEQVPMCPCTQQWGQEALFNHAKLALCCCQVREYKAGHRKQNLQPAWGRKRRTREEEENQRSPGCVPFKRPEPMAKCYFRIRYEAPAQHHLPAVSLLPVGELG